MEHIPDDHDDLVRPLILSWSEEPEEEEESLYDEPLLTVSQLAAEIERALDRTFHRVRVIGDVAEAKIWRKEWVFLSIKDEEAQINAIIIPEAFRNLKRLGRLPVEGEKYIFVGRVGFYKRRGELRLEIIDCIPAGISQLHQAYFELKEKLHKEGLFNLERKRPLPVPVLNIGVVTSTDGAAVRDVLKTLHKGGFSLHIEVHPESMRTPLEPYLDDWRSGDFPLYVRIHHSLVQGDQAPHQLINALMNLDSSGDLDVIIITRGGGSILDLWSFNDEQLARTIAACQTPVISAIGHEKDETICDLVADKRASTPTQAAEILVRHNRTIFERLFYLDDRLDLLISRMLEQWLTRFQVVSRLDDLIERTIAHRRSDIAQLSYELDRMVRDYIDRIRRHFDDLRARLTPLHLLQLQAERYRVIDSLVQRLDRNVRETLQTFDRSLYSHAREMEQHLKINFQNLENRFASSTARLAPHHLLRKVMQAREQFENLTHRFIVQVNQLLETREMHLSALTRALENNSLQATLKRGFSLTLDAETGAIIRSVHHVRPGSSVTTRVQDGTFSSKIEHIQEVEDEYPGKPIH